MTSTAGFVTTGGTLLIAGQTITYTGVTATSFTGVSGVTATVVNGTSVTPSAWQGFATTPVTLSTPDAAALATGKLGGDGFVDLVVGANPGQDEVFLNRGNSSTTGAWDGFGAGIAIGPADGATTALAIGDVNGDGVADLVVGFDGAAPEVFLNDGRPTTTLSAGLATGATTIDVASTAGFTGSATSGGTLLIAGQTITYAGLTATSFTGVSGVTAAVTGGTSVTPSAWQGFAAGTPLNTGTPDTTAIALADLNGDGAPDLIVADAGTTSDVYLNQGGKGAAWSGFGAAQPFTTTAGATSLTLGDVNGDGAVDLILGETGAAPQLFENPGENASGTWQGFKPAIALSSADATAPTAAGVALAQFDPTNPQSDLLLTQAAGPALLFAGDTVLVTRLGFSGVTAGLTATTGASGTVTVTNGRGAFLVEPGADGGLAGTFSGTITASAAGVGGTVSASVAFNDTKLAINDTVVVNGVSIPIVFTSSQEQTGGDPYVAVSGSGSVSLGNFVEIEGNFSWSTSTPTSPQGQSPPLTIFLGQGPGFEGTTLNPTARGLYLVVGKYEAAQSGGGYAFYATGTVQIVGITGVTVSGTVTVQFNNTGAAAFGGTGGIPVANNADSFEGSGLTITVDGVSLTGDIGFTYNGTIFTIDLGSAAVAGGSPVTLDLGPATTTGTTTTYPVEISLAAASLSMSAAGIYGELTGLSPTLNVPGVTFPAGVTADLTVNTTTVTQTDAVNGDTIAARSFALQVTIPSGPSELTILGQSLSGTFAFSQVTLPASPQAAPGSAPTTLVQIAATGVSLTLGTTSAGLGITNASGLLLISSAGVAGQLTATPTFFGLSNASFIGTFTVQFNTATAAVVQQFTVGGVSTSLTLPAGPYFRIEGDSVALAIAGQTVTGSFAFESATDGSGNPIVRVAASNLSASFGDGSASLVTLSGASGLLVFSSAGVAGQLRGSVSVSIPDVTLAGTLTLQVNTTGAPLTESMSFGPQAGDVSAVAVGDVNGDGRPDLIVATSSGATESILEYLNDGTADPYNTLAPITIASGTFSTTALALADVNGDGALYLLVVNDGSANQVYLGDGKGDFTPSTASLGVAAGSTTPRSRSATSTATAGPT